MHTVTFFITTARSGTQWVHEALRYLYSDLLVTEHEPIRYSYSPKRCLRNPAAMAALRTDPIVRRHLDEIHRTTKERNYVEVGFPAFAAAPLLWEEFGERLRLVQLVRHPVRVAASIVTHRWFDPDPLDRADLKEHVVLTPNDPGVRLGHYAERWAGMTAFEKALFYWTEVHLYGREVQDAFFSVPFLRVNFEDILAREETRRRFAQFLGVPYRSDWNDFPQRRVDRYHNQTYNAIDVRNIHGIPEARHLAADFGYDIDGIENGELQERYRLSLISRLRRGVRSRIKRIVVFGAAVAMGSNGGDVLDYF
jgi:hypothetical protein